MANPQMDLTKLSDDELDALEQRAKPAPKQVSAPDLSSLSDEELDSLEQKVSKPNSMGHDYLPKQGPLDTALAGVGIAGKAVDSYTGAPTRAALSELAGTTAKTGNPVKGLVNAGAAFYNQFGQNPDNAPTGEEMAQSAGATGKTAKVAGFGLDAVSDWTNLLPPVEAAKLAGKYGSQLLKFGGSKALGVAEGAAKGTAKGVDALTGAKLGEKTIEVAGNVGDRVVDTTRRLKDYVKSQYSPTLSPNFNDFSAAAKRQGLDDVMSTSPSLAFGNNSVISKKQRYMTEGPFGQKLIEEHNRGLDLLDNKINETVSKINAGNLTPGEAGQMIAKDMDKFREGVIAKDDLLFGSIYNGPNKQAGLLVNKDAASELGSSLKGIEREAIRLSKRGSQTEAGEGVAILKELQQFKNNFDNSGRISFKRAHEFQQDIAKTAFKETKPGDPISPYQKEMQNLYFSIKDSLESTVRKDVSPEFADEILKNNAKWSTYRSNFDEIANSYNRSAPEQLINQVFANTDKINAVKQTMSPQAFDVARGNWLQKRLRTDSEGKINFRSLQDDLKKNPDVYSALFNKDELQTLKDVSTLGANYGADRLSFSGTGSSNQFSKNSDSVFGWIKGKADPFIQAGMDMEHLDRLKAKARGIPYSGPSTSVSIDPAVISKSADNVPASSILEKLDVLGQNKFARALGARRTPIGQSAKAAQVLSVDGGNRQLKDKEKESNIKSAIDRRLRNKSL